MADTLLILALPSFRSLWLLPMSMLSFSPNCWLCSWASKDFVWHCTPRPLMNALKARCMTCAMHGMWFLNAGLTIPEASSVDCSSRVIEWFEEALSGAIRSKQPWVSSNQPRTSFKWAASHAPVCQLLTYHLVSALKMGKEQVINLIVSELNFTQCPISIHMVSNDGRCG